MEEEHEPRFRVLEALPHLFVLEVLVFHTSLVLAQVIDDDSLLSLVDELGFDGRVGEEEANHQSPDNGHGTGDPEHGAPLVLASQEADAPADWTCEAYGKTYVCQYLESFD